MSHGCIEGDEFGPSEMKNDEGIDEEARKNHCHFLFFVFFFIDLKRGGSSKAHGQTPLVRYGPTRPEGPSVSSSSSWEMKNDEEVVLSSVQKDLPALQYACFISHSS